MSGESEEENEDLIDEIESSEVLSFLSSTSAIDTCQVRGNNENTHPVYDVIFYAEGNRNGLGRIRSYRFGALRQFSETLNASAMLRAKPLAAKFPATTIQSKIVGLSNAQVDARASQLEAWLQEIMSRRNEMPTMLRLATLHFFNFEEKLFFGVDSGTSTSTSTSTPPVSPGAVSGNGASPAHRKPQLLTQSSGSSLLNTASMLSDDPFEKRGFMAKEGHVVKNWKLRYFELSCDASDSMRTSSAFIFGGGAAVLRYFNTYESYRRCVGFQANDGAGVAGRGGEEDGELSDDDEDGEMQDRFLSSVSHAPSFSAAIKTSIFSRGSIFKSSGRSSSSSSSRSSSSRSRHASGGHSSRISSSASRLTLSGIRNSFAASSAGPAGSIPLVGCTMEIVDDSSDASPSVPQLLTPQNVEKAAAGGGVGGLAAGAAGGGAAAAAGGGGGGGGGGGAWKGGRSESHKKVAYAFRFELRTADGTVYPLSCASEDDRSSWMAAIQAAAIAAATAGTANPNALPSYLRAMITEGVNERGNDDNDEDEDEDDIDDKAAAGAGSSSVLPEAIIGELLARARALVQRNPKDALARALLAPSGTRDEGATSSSSSSSSQGRDIQQQQQQQLGPLAWATSLPPATLDRFRRCVEAGLAVADVLHRQRDGGGDGGGDGAPPLSEFASRGHSSTAAAEACEVQRPSDYVDCEAFFGPLVKQLHRESSAYPAGHPTSLAGFAWTPIPGHRADNLSLADAGIRPSPDGEAASSSGNAESEVAAICVAVSRNLSPASGVDLPLSPALRKRHRLALEQWFIADVLPRMIGDSSSSSSTGSDGDASRSVLELLENDCSLRVLTLTSQEQWPALQEATPSSADAAPRRQLPPGTPEFVDMPTLLQTMLDSGCSEAETKRLESFAVAYSSASSASSLSSSWCSGRGVLLYCGRASAATGSPESEQGGGGRGGEAGKKRAGAVVAVAYGFEDHLRIICDDSAPSAVGDAFRRVERFLRLMDAAARQQKRSPPPAPPDESSPIFATHREWGYLTTSPQRLGTAMSASVVGLRVPNLMAEFKMQEIAAMALRYGLVITASHATGEARIDVTPTRTMYITEGEIATRLFHGVRLLAKKDRELDHQAGGRSQRKGTLSSSSSSPSSSSSSSSSKETLLPRTPTVGTDVSGQVNSSSGGTGGGAVSVAELAASLSREGKATALHKFKETMEDGVSVVKFNRRGGVGMRRLFLVGEHTLTWRGTGGSKGGRGGAAAAASTSRRAVSSAVLVKGAELYDLRQLQRVLRGEDPEQEKESGGGDAQAAAALSSSARLLLGTATLRTHVEKQPTVRSLRDGGLCGCLVFPKRSVDFGVDSRPLRDSLVLGFHLLLEDLRGRAAAGEGGKQ